MFKLSLYLCLAVSQLSQAQVFRFDLKIDSKSYNLKVLMEFRKGILLPEITQGLRNGAILAGVSDTVQSVTLTPSQGDHYQSLMVVKSWGLKSRLISNCDEIHEVKKWTRKCQLETRQADGGRYMYWKSDLVSCEPHDQGVRCILEILGQSKPIVILGLQLANPQTFALKAKEQALNNFVKVWMVLDQADYKFSRVQEKFKNSQLQSQIKEMSDRGTKVLRLQDDFQFSAEYREPAD